MAKISRGLKEPVMAPDFSTILSKWNSEANARQMPWKGEKDPYKIWVSEIILQQTRVEQGMKYYDRFISVFPDIHHLANAPDPKIYKVWEGLGYYGRCRNMIETARHISKNLGGEFPSRYEDLSELKGVGPYTAAAIASFAFNKPNAVLDGNVFRVLSRIFGIAKPIDNAEGKKYFKRIAQSLLNEQKSAEYNQAIMDFGAVVCKPMPDCAVCPFINQCSAFARGAVSEFPVKSKKVLIRKRWFHYVLIEHEGKLAIRQRVEKDIWRNLFEFFLIETEATVDEDGIVMELKKYPWLKTRKGNIKSISSIYRQQLTHQLIEGRFIYLESYEKPALPADLMWVKKKDIKTYAFPKIINQHLANMKGLS